MKIKKKNRVDELGDVIPIDFFSVSSLVSLRSFLEAARLGLMYMQAPLDGYNRLLTRYQSQTTTRIRAAEDQRDFRTITYLEQVRQIIQQAIKDTKQANLYMNNPIQLFPRLGLGHLEDNFKMDVLDEWIRYVQGATPTFDARKIMVRLEQNQRYNAQEKKDQTDLWLFIGCFEGLKEKLSQGDAEMLAKIQTLTEAEYPDICRKLIPIINEDFEAFKDDTDDVNPKHNRSKKDVEKLMDDGLNIDDSDDDLINSDDDENQDRDKYY